MNASRARAEPGLSKGHTPGGEGTLGKSDLKRQGRQHGAERRRDGRGSCEREQLAPGANHENDGRARVSATGIQRGYSRSTHFWNAASFSRLILPVYLHTQLFRTFGSTIGPHCSMAAANDLRPRHSASVHRTRAYIWVKRRCACDVTHTRATAAGRAADQPTDRLHSATLLSFQRMMSSIVVGPSICRDMPMPCAWAIPVSVEWPAIAFM